MAKRSFLGFGFGPIQSGLFLLEACLSGNFDHFTIAEVNPELVAQIRANGGSYTVNIAHLDHIQAITVEGIEIFNPNESQDRRKLIQAIRDADELATALPSVKFYSGGSSSVAAMLAEALADDQYRTKILYAAENDNHAARKLRDAIKQQNSEVNLSRFQVVDTVIGKMSGAAQDPQVMQRLGLEPMTPTGGRAVLVEQFNRILISQINLPDFHRGIPVFQEKPDLLPFEEAKLYGHNAVHALVGYLAHARGLKTMDAAGQDQKLMNLARAALIDESGAALIKKYTPLGDSLFTPQGWQDYADDLLPRMTNVYLNDQVDRVIRDPVRKLGWNDRLFGAMRLVLSQGISPHHLAQGAAAAVQFHLGHRPTNRQQLVDALASIWMADAIASEADRLIDLTWNATGQQL